MIEKSVHPVTRRIAADLGKEAGIRPFHARALMRLSREEAMALLERAVKLYPRDAEGRGEYVRRKAVRGER